MAREARGEGLPKGAILVGALLAWALPLVLVLAAAGSLGHGSTDPGTVQAPAGESAPSSPSTPVAPPAKAPAAASFRTAASASGDGSGTSHASGDDGASDDEADDEDDENISGLPDAPPLPLPQLPAPLPGLDALPLPAQVPDLAAVVAERASEMTVSAPAVDAAPGLVANLVGSLPGAPALP